VTDSAVVGITSEGGGDINSTLKSICCFSLLQIRVLVFPRRVFIRVSDDCRALLLPAKEPLLSTFLHTNRHRTLAR